jgi:hypothetical protein
VLVARIAYICNGNELGPADREEIHPSIYQMDVRVRRVCVRDSEKSLADVSPASHACIYIHFRGRGGKRQYGAFTSIILGIQRPHVHALYAASYIYIS